MSNAHVLIILESFVFVLKLAAFHANLTELQCVHDHFSDAEDDDVGRGESNGT